MAPCPHHVLDNLLEIRPETTATNVPTCSLQGLAPAAAAGVTDDTAAVTDNGAGTSPHDASTSQPGAGACQHDAGTSQHRAAVKSMCNPMALVAAARQAAGLLEQSWQKREQHLVTCAQRRSKQRHR